MRRKRLAIWQELALGIGVVAFLGYAVLSFAPVLLAPLISESAWKKLGNKVLVSLTSGAAPCSSESGRQALAALLGRLAEGGSLPEVLVEVYPISIMNAWALPGHRVVVTSELIAKADSADELAGVIAHELGHIREQHAERQIIRQLGIGTLSALGGDSNGLAATLAVLRYSRDDEKEADRIAQELLRAAAVSPEGLRSFFLKIQQEEGRPFLGELGNMMSTHPVTQDRINAIRPLPPGVVPRPSLPEESWRSLKSMCDH